MIIRNKKFNIVTRNLRFLITQARYQQKKIEKQQKDEVNLLHPKENDESDVNLQQILEEDERDVTSAYPAEAFESKREDEISDDFLNEERDWKHTAKELEEEAMRIEMETEERISTLEGRNIESKEEFQQMEVNMKEVGENVNVNIKETVKEKSESIVKGEHKIEDRVHHAVSWVAEKLREGAENVKKMVEKDQEELEKDALKKKPAKM